MSCLVDSLAVVADRVEDLRGGLGPDVGARVLVPGLDPLADVAVQRADGAVRTAAQSLVVSSPNHRSTRLIHEAGRGEVQVEAGVRREPALDLRRLVAGGVVEDEMDIEIGGHVLVDRFEELQELEARWRRCRAPITSPLCDVERRVQARGAVALVVVRGALGGAGQQRQDRRGAVQCLDLALLVHAEHDGAFGRVQVQPADVVEGVSQGLCKAGRMEPHAFNTRDKRISFQRACSDPYGAGGEPSGSPPALPESRESDSGLSEEQVSEAVEQARLRGAVGKLSERERRELAETVVAEFSEGPSCPRSWASGCWTRCSGR